MAGRIKLRDGDFKKSKIVMVDGLKVFEGSKGDCIEFIRLVFDSSWTEKGVS